MCEFLDSTNSLIQTFSLSKHLHQSLFRLIVLTNCITLTPKTFPLYIYFVLFYGFKIASRLTARRVPCLNPDCCLEWHSEVFFGCWLSFVSLSALIMLKFHIWTHHSIKPVATDFSQINQMHLLGPVSGLFLDDFQILFISCRYFFRPSTLFSHILISSLFPLPIHPLSLAEITTLCR